MVISDNHRIRELKVTETMPKKLITKREKISKIVYKKNNDWEFKDKDMRSLMRVTRQLTSLTSITLKFTT